MIKKGLSPRLGEIGKIKIGGKGPLTKSSGGKKFHPPIRFNSFLVTTTERGPDGNYIPDKEIMDKLGKDPKELRIKLPFDSIDMNFFTSYQLYSGKKLQCKGDGITAEWRNKEGNMEKAKCDPEKCPHMKSEKCKVSGILSCMLADSMEIGGIYRFRTHSWNSVSSILAALTFFADNTNGILQGLPLKLKMVKKATADHGNVNTVTVVIDGIEMLKLREIAQIEYTNRLELGIDMKRLELEAKNSGIMIDRDEPGEVEAEYYNTEPGEVGDLDEPSEAVPEEKPGANAEDVKKKLKDKAKESKAPETVTDDNQGSLL